MFYKNVSLIINEVFVWESFGKNSRLILTLWRSNVNLIRRVAELTKSQACCFPLKVYMHSFHTNHIKVFNYIHFNRNRLVSIFFFFFYFFFPERKSLREQTPGETKAELQFLVSNQNKCHVYLRVTTFQLRIQCHYKLYDSVTKEIVTESRQNAPLGEIYRLFRNLNEKASDSLFHSMFFQF